MVNLRGIQAALANNIQLVQELLQDEVGLQRIHTFAVVISDCFRAGGKVLICGNGGSACDAMHFAEELTGKFRKGRRALPAISLNDPGHITCVGNDFGFEFIFSRAVEAYGKPGDVLIALSTSGNSPNVIQAVRKAQEQEMQVACLLGKDGGKLAGQSNYEWIIRGKTTDRIQEVHMMILHILIEEIERNMFPDLY